MFIFPAHILAGDTIDDQITGRTKKIRLIRMLNFEPFHAVPEIGENFLYNVTGFVTIV
ncbi:hypothetical protein D3C81_2262660 [compost metagenome]